MRRLLLFAALTGIAGVAKGDDKVVKPEPSYRADSANQHLPWYRIKPGEFPPAGSEHRVTGELLEADFIHRSGQFRAAGTGELVDFSLLPFATVMVVNAEGDLRDITIGTTCTFSLYQDDRGAFTRVAAIEDEFTRVARLNSAYHIEKVESGTIDATIQGKPIKLAIGPKTIVWKEAKAAKSTDLAAGFDVRLNFAGSSPQGLPRCSEIWADAASQTLATDQHHKRHFAFLRERGLAGWIDEVAGKKLTVTPFGDPSSLQALFKQDGIDPARWASEHRVMDTVVANEELRTYNPPVDRKRSRILEFRAIPTGDAGCAGVRWVIEPDLLLEGFRKHHVIRMFAHPSWKVDDMPFGECLYYETPNVRPLTEEAVQFPYRTDFANEDLPWYRLKPGEFPPLHSHHLVIGELIQADPGRRSGRFSTDRTGEVVDFTMPPFGTVYYANAEADLTDVPIGTRCHFWLHPDDTGTFTRATVIRDVFTEMAGDLLSFRLDSADLDAGTLLLSRRHEPVKDERDATVQPPDYGRGQFAVNRSTRVWKGDQPAALADLAPGDFLQLNASGQSATDRGVCTEIWAGVESQKLAADRQRSRTEARLKERGIPAWIDRVDGKSITLTFFSGDRKGFKIFLDRDRDASGDGVFLTPVDDALNPSGPASIKMHRRDQSREAEHSMTYGSSSVRWRVEAEKSDERFRVGQVVRVAREGWPGLLKGQP